MAQSETVKVRRFAQKPRRASQCQDHPGLLSTLRGVTCVIPDKHCSHAMCAPNGFLRDLPSMTGSASQTNDRQVGPVPRRFPKQAVRALSLETCDESLQGRRWLAKRGQAPAARMLTVAKTTFFGVMPACLSRGKNRAGLATFGVNEGFLRGVAFPLAHARIAQGCSSRGALGTLQGGIHRRYVPWGYLRYSPDRQPPILA